MKKPSTIGRTRLVVAAVVVAAAGVFASVGMAGYGAELVGLSHKSATPTTDQYQGAKVTICHHTHSQKNPFVTITVSQNAVAAHVRNHGDTIGPCSEQPPAVPVVPAKNKSHKLLKAHKAKHKATKAKLHQKGTSKGKQKGHAKNEKAVGNKPTTGPSAAQHGNGQAKGHSKTHGPKADHGQGQGHGQDKTQKDHSQGHGHDNGGTHGNSGGGGNGNGNGKGH
jgi:hypothetical protein